MPSIDLLRRVNRGGLRDAAPRDRTALKHWIKAYLGVDIACAGVCPGHQSVWDYFADLYFDRPPLVLVLGSRGCGKSFLSALNPHVTSRWSPRHGTRILGGSRAQ